MKKKCIKDVTHIYLTAVVVWTRKLCRIKSYYAKNLRSLRYTICKGSMKGENRHIYIYKIVLNLSETFKWPKIYCANHVREVKQGMITSHNNQHYS